MKRVRGDLPSGTVTFLFTDVEGSTRLLHELGAEAYAEALGEHRRILRDAFAAHGGVEVDTQGDAFFVAFPTAPGALRAAQDALEGLSPGPIRVRMGIHTGTPHLAEEGYVGQDVHRAARVAASGHGGQVLVSEATRRLVDERFRLLDMGEHRLKDFDEPIPLYQLGDESFPPLKTISNTNLPRPASSFVGREREVEEVVSLLQDGARLLTLTGPGGTGKTRLALEAAAELVPEFKAGVFWVGLAPLRDPALVTETIAQALGAKDGLAEHIGEREFLLLLDNLEQVVEAAPELAALVEACPNLRLLVTSRELLRVRGEVEYPVTPLAEPEAVELFFARAKAEPDATIEELCRALDNLPLALELAAARASVLSPRQILERLSKRLDLLKGGRDADPRQQTLRATIEWSYELLSPEEQRLFARLAVFRGSCTLEAAEEVADADLDALQSLVDKSLLRRRDERFWMLETIREYAGERLEEAHDGEVIRERHLEHFLAVAEEADSGMRVDDRWGERLECLEEEHDNNRAALDRVEASARTQLALRYVAALWRFWLFRGHLTEGRRRLRAALHADERPTAARARALNGATLFAWAVEEDHAGARRFAEEALELDRRLGDAWGTAYSGLLLGQVALDEGDHASALRLLDESARALSALGDEVYSLVASGHLADTYYELGQRDRARALQEDNLHRARAGSHERIEAMTLNWLAEHALDDGRLEDALSLLRGTVRIYHDLGDRGQGALSLCLFAHALARTGMAGDAVRLLAAAEALVEEMEGRVHRRVASRNEQTLAAVRTQLDEAVFTEAWEEGHALTFDEAVALALDSPE